MTGDAVDIDSVINVTASVLSDVGHGELLMLSLCSEYVQSVLYGGCLC